MTNSMDIGPLQPGRREIEGRTVRTAFPDDWPETEKLAGELAAAPNVPKRVFEALDFIIDKFLRLPVVRDDFDSDSADSKQAHQARRIWEQTLLGEVKLQLDQNALAGGHLSGVLPVFDAFLTMSSIPTQEKLYAGGNGTVPRATFALLAEEARGWQEKYERQYPSMSLEEKTAFMTQSRAFVRSAIKRIIEAYQQ